MAFVYWPVKTCHWSVGTPLKPAGPRKSRALEISRISRRQHGNSKRGGNRDGQSASHLCN